MNPTPEGPDVVRHPPTMPEERAVVWVSMCFVASALAAIGLAVVYVAGGQPQLEGALLGVALGGIGAGLVVWGKHLIPNEIVVGDRGTMGSPAADKEATARVVHEAGEVFSRRPLLMRLLVAAAAAFGLAAVFPIRSLGPSPGRALFETPWRNGLRLVEKSGRPLKAEDLPVGGIATVFPEGHTDAADAQTVLVRVDEDLLRPPAGREDWSPQGNVAYSKICTHAGCPVGLYRAQTHELFCPCHQSTFDVLDGARPVFGPAARPLPQLPLEVDRDGYLLARGDFSAPVGPTFWDVD